MILQSPLDPRIPIESLQGMPDDGTILILKHFYMDLCSDSIRRLYGIVPDLNDSPKRSESPSEKNYPVEDAGTDILRAWFRIMVLNDSEAGTLEHATRSKTINEFLLGCQASQLGCTVTSSKKPGVRTRCSTSVWPFVPRLLRLVT